MTIDFYHGRNSIDEDLDDWGFEGPRLVDVNVQWTYGQVKFWSGDYMHHMVVTGDLIPIDGKFYGDFGVEEEEKYNTVSSFSHRKHITLKEFIELNKI